jgi:hypothetical protein
MVRIFLASANTRAVSFAKVAENYYISVKFPGM